MSVAVFVKTMLDRWPPFRWDETQERAYAEDLQRELSGFRADVLERARRDMVRKRTKTQTPSVAECIGYCEEAKKWTDAENNKGKLPVEQRDPFIPSWRDDDFASSIALNRKDPLCVQAAKEGWIGLLHTFVRRNRRMPSATQKIAYRQSTKAPEQFVTEIEWCKREAKDFADAYAACVRGASGLAGVALRDLERLGASMLQKRKELTAEVLGASK